MKGKSGISIPFLLLMTLVFIVPMSCGASSPVWTEKTPMPTARYGLAIGTVNGKVYAIGGKTDSMDITTKNEEYTPSSDSWTTKLPMPTARIGLAIGVVNGKLYAIGGYKEGSGPLNAVEEYDPVTNAWSIKSPMPTARSFLAVGVVNGKIYAIGGYDKGGGLSTPCYNTVEVYDPSLDTWASKTSMPTKRAGLAVGVVNGKIYAIGGMDYTSFLDTNEMYDPNTNSWTTKPPMPTPRMLLGIGVVNNKVYAIGGGSGNGLDSTEVYDPNTNTWDIITPMPTARSYLAVGVANDKIYAIGGRPWSSGTPIHSKNEELSVVVPPSANFTYSPVIPRARLPVTFNASKSYDPDGYLVNYTWDFDDGNVTTVTESVITHVYNVIGTYVVNLTVTDNESLNGSTSATIMVLEDLTPPAITLISPENKTYNVASVSLEFAVNKTTSWIGYNLDNQANVTITGNTTLHSMPDGLHYVTVYANDTFGNMGASNTVYFTVDITPPNITDVSQIPLTDNVLPEDEVKVNATIVDELSGIKQVTLNYTNGNGTGISVEMTNFEGNIWNATIPAFPYCTNVTYVIIAEDKANNTITTEELEHKYQYHVIPEFQSFLILPLFMIATLSAVIVYRKKHYM